MKISIFHKRNLFSSKETEHFHILPYKILLDLLEYIELYLHYIQTTFLCEDVPFLW